MGNEFWIWFIRACAQAGTFGLIWNLKSEKGSAWGAAAWGTIAATCWFQLATNTWLP